MSRSRTLLETLLAEPERFGFDSAVAVLMRAAGDWPGAAGDRLRFRASAGLAFIGSDVASVERGDGGFGLETGAIGLTGPSGVLPRPYTELVNAERRRHSPALAAFLDLLAQRPIAAYAAAGFKYRPHRTAQAARWNAPGDAAPRDGARDALLALTGYGTPHLAPRLEAGTGPLLFYAGLFATHPRSADRLAGMVSDWLGQPVAVEQFAGSWLRIDTAEASVLPRAGEAGRFNRLGVDAAIGARCWDVQSSVRLRLGPLPLAGFEALLPDRQLFARLASLVRAFLGPQIGVSFNPVLAAAEVLPLRLGAGGMSRLGWSAWLPTTGTRRVDGVEAVFDADGAGPVGVSPA